MAVLAGRQARADGRATLSHFVNYAQGEHPYSHQRYANEYNRCLGVLERRLEGREFIVGEYSIADMCSWPWVLISKPWAAARRIPERLALARGRARPPGGESAASISARNGAAPTRPRMRSARSCSTRPPARFSER